MANKQSLNLGNLNLVKQERKENATVADLLKEFGFKIESVKVVDKVKDGEVINTKNGYSIANAQIRIVPDEKGSLIKNGSNSGIAGAFTMFAGLGYMEHGKDKKVCMYLTMMNSDYGSSTSIASNRVKVETIEHTYPGGAFTEVRTNPFARVQDGDKTVSVPTAFIDSRNMFAFERVIKASIAEPASKYFKISKSKAELALLEPEYPSKDAPKSTKGSVKKVTAAKVKKTSPKKQVQTTKRGKMPI
jgi:hypothetical protein